jgi:hypothetical protein
MIVVKRVERMKSRIRSTAIAERDKHAGLVRFGDSGNPGAKLRGLALFMRIG